MSHPKLVTLDKRHNGNEFWKYYIQQPVLPTVTESVRTFFLWRQWCWAEWGASKELCYFDDTDLFDDLDCSNTKWCWSSMVANKNRIYLRDDQAASMFALRWT
jgi:hypothetical protein